MYNEKSQMQHLLSIFIYCYDNSIHIEDTEIDKSDYRNYSVVESLRFSFRYKGLDILGIFGFHNISKPKIKQK